MVDFNNTETAFAGKTDSDLKRGYWLFKIIAWNWLIKIGPILLKVFMPFGFPIPIIKATIFKQFCGGESIEGCNHTIDELGYYNIKTILDYSVEGKEKESIFDDNVAEVISTIQKAKADFNIPFSVFKPTGFARFELLQKVNLKEKLNQKEKEEFKRVRNRIDKICEAAFNFNIPVFIDAEETWIQNPIDAIALEMMRKYNKEKTIVFNTIQLYRKDRIIYLKELMAIARNEGFYMGLKLVRGAYIEKERERAKKMNYEDPMHKTKEDTDRDYNLALKLCIENIDVISFSCASHNEKSNLYLIELMKEHAIEKNDKRIYFAQLLGMSDHISMNLGKAGYNVAKYVPYGPVKDVTPYLIRRAEENTSIAGQTGRELALILAERKRREVKNIEIS
ncbi:MAG: proline dehydrogenase family protein [Vicingus serpentipes]|nr:proline dehydrogenase family protein [Vicingus serpentipes]